MIRVLKKCMASRRAGGNAIQVGMVGVITGSKVLCRFLCLLASPRALVVPVMARVFFFFFVDKLFLLVLPPSVAVSP